MTKVSGMPICLCGLRADEHIGKRCKKKKKDITPIEPIEQGGKKE